MNLFKKVEKLLFNFIMFSLIIKTVDNEICSANIDCNKCDKCVIGDNTNALCEYGNLFCNNNNIINFFSEQKLSFINYYRQNSEANSICGEQSINVNSGSNGNTVIILGNENKNYLKENSLHCNYEIKNIVDQKYKAYLSLSLSLPSYLSENNSNNQLSFSVYVIFPNSIDIFTDNNLRMKEKIIQINDDDEFSILLDIHTINNYNELIDIKESLNIKVKKKFKKKRDYQKDDEMLQDENGEGSTIHEFYKVICIIFAGILGLVILIIFILRNCLKRRFPRERPRQENILNQIVNINTNIENQKKEIEIKKKIELLFNTKFITIKYSSNILGNANSSCSICLEKFVEDESMVSLTSCNHIFHYDCLKKWSEKNTGHFKCPNCNYDFLKEEEPMIINVKKKREGNPNMNQNLNFNNNINFLDNISNGNNIDTLRSNNFL